MNLPRSWGPTTALLAGYGYALSGSRWAGLGHFVRITEKKALEPPQ